MYGGERPHTYSHTQGGGDGHGRSRRYARRARRFIGGQSLICRASIMQNQGPQPTLGYAYARPEACP
jgi:hypothetical protein